MFIKSEETLRMIYIFCTAQFLLILIFTLINSRPMTQQSMLTVALSLTFGIMFSGTARRDYQAYREIQKKEKTLRNLDQTLKTFREEKE